MSRRLILMAICLMMLASSLLAHAQQNEASIVSDQIALMALREETLDGMKALLNKGLTTKERLDRLTELAIRVDNRRQEMLKANQINGMDYINEGSAYSLAYKAISGAAVLSGMRFNSQGEVNPRDCSQTRGVLMGNYIFNPPPNDLPNSTDLLLEELRALLCSKQK